MQSTIVYFTGTGNSLAVARLLAKKLPESSVISVNEMLRRPSLPLKTDFFGFVFPVYCQDAPEILRRLLRQITIPPIAYIFSVSTHNGDPGYCHHTINKFLKKKGLRLHSGFSLLMPGNCITPFNSTNSEKEIKRRLEAVGSIVDKIAAKILNKHPAPFEGSASLKKRLRGIRNIMRFKVIYKVPQRFWATDTCDLCGLCASICPENNITIGAISPSWGKNCQMCLACIHWCPKGAIQNGSGTINLKRYHHPDISINDMLISNKNNNIF